MHPRQVTQVLPSSPVKCPSLHRIVIRLTLRGHRKTKAINLYGSTSTKYELHKKTAELELRKSNHKKLKIRVYFAVSSKEKTDNDTRERNEFIRDCEAVISIENSAWMAEMAK